MYHEQQSETWRNVLLSDDIAWHGHSWSEGFLWVRSFQKTTCFNCSQFIALLIIIRGHPPTFILGFQSVNKMTEYMSEMYFPTYAHLSPYFIGILVGYYFKTGALTLRLTMVDILS